MDPAQEPLMATVTDHCHGKARVRVARRWVDEAGVQHFMDLTAQVLTWSDACLPSYLEGDNSFVVATDTCKNLAYHVMKDSKCTSPDHFAVAYAQKFLSQYPHIKQAETWVQENVWSRMTTGGEPHNHAFTRGSGNEQYTAHAVVARDAPTTLDSGISGLSLLKTTQSSWTGFHRDEYRTLPDVGERMLATELAVTWKYTAQPSEAQMTGIRAQVRQLLLDGFSGPAAAGSFSPGVQYSLHKMGSAVMAVMPNISWMELTAPNIHYIPAPALAAVGKVKFEDDVFLPTDEPRGLIKLVLSQAIPAKL